MLIFLALPFCCQIKNTGVLSGNILDLQTKKALSYVNIVCKSKTKTVITGGITNSKGSFIITELPLDSIFIDIQFIGYQTIKKAFYLSKNKPKTPAQGLA
jgi:hypothetical protein